MGVPFSMTGFGKCLVDNPLGRQQWEVRSVNGRYLDVKFRLPRIAKPFEFQLEKLARRHARRGRLDISLGWMPGEKFEPQCQFNAAAAQKMLSSLKEFASFGGWRFDPDVASFLQMPEMWTEPETDQDEKLLREFENGLAMALADWNQSRQAEGESLVDDLATRLLKMQGWLHALIELEPKILAERRESFTKRVTDLLTDYNLDKTRINQELVILADRFDVAEELTRLTTHLERLGDLLRNSPADLGKRLEFTLQECNREVNTLGNKLLDSRVSAYIVDFKNELEKCREQTMNLE